MIYSGGLSVDDRGKVSFANDFDFKDVKRFYVVENHNKGHLRAWHGHKKEAKYVYVVSGSAKIGVATGEDFESYVLSADKPQVLYIPAGSYNGCRTLTDDAKVIYFSTATLEESKQDDQRLPEDTWEL